MLFELLQFTFGTSYKNRARRDSYKPGTIFKNAISPKNTYGECFSCNGTGHKTIYRKYGDGFTVTCRKCNGSGWHKY